MSRSPHPLAALLVVCLVLAGTLGACGESEEDRAAATVEEYFDALAARDFDRSCELASPALRRTLTRFAQERRLDGARAGCQMILRRLAEINGPRLVRLQADVEAREVAIDGERAEVQLSGSGQSAQLRRDGDGWSIVSLDFSGATGGG